MASRMPTLLIRYGELGLKSESVRRRFEQMLIQDMKRKHVLAQVPCVITSTRGRLYLDSDDWRRSCEILSKTFGVVSFSPVTKVSSDLEDLRKATVEFSEPLMFVDARFAVRTRRTGNHSYTSQTLAEELGSALLSSFENEHLKVSLDEPDIEVFVEVRDKHAYLYSSVLPGPGGMPKNTQGRILSVADVTRSIASSWLMMKRGCNVIAAVKDNCDIDALKTWDPDLKSIEYERDLFGLAQRHDCQGIAMPWMLDDLEDRKPPKGDLPVFYPLIGMNHDEVGALLSKITR